MPSEVKWAISFLAGGVLMWIGWKLYFVLVTLHVHGLPGAHCRDSAAKRRSGGLGGRVRRIGQPDGIRSAWRGDVSFCAPPRGARSMFMFTSMAADSDSGQPTTAAADTPCWSRLKADEVGAGPIPRQPPAASFAGSTAGSDATAMRRARRIKVSKFRHQLFRSIVRSWRNWQTHQLEGLAVAIPWWFESTRPHQNAPTRKKDRAKKIETNPRIILEIFCACRI